MVETEMRMFCSGPNGSIFLLVGFQNKEIGIKMPHRPKFIFKIQNSKIQKEMLDKICFNNGN